MKIAILGAGAFGTALAYVLEKHKPSLVDVKKDGTYSSKAKQEISNADTLVIAVPSNALEKCCEMIKPLIKKNAIILSTIKAIYKDIKTPTQIIRTKLKKKANALAGLNFSREIKKDVPTEATIAGPNAAKLAKIFTTKKFFARTAKNPITLEIGAAAKNALAIAIGLVQGHYGKHSLNLQGAILAQGIEEINKICNIQLRPFIADVFGSCKAGSRNLEFGKKFAKCRSFGKCKKIGTVEGIQTIRALRTHKTPLMQTLHRIIFGNEKITELEKCIR